MYIGNLYNSLSIRLFGGLSSSSVEVQKGHLANVIQRSFTYCLRIEDWVMVTQKSVRKIQIFTFSKLLSVIPGLGERGIECLLSKYQTMLSLGNGLKKYAK